MTDTAIIRSVIHTLNQIPVSGKENLDKLLGCILTLERLIKDEPVPDAVDEQKRREGK